MRDTAVIPKELVEHARDYWDEQGEPDLREPAPGDRCFFIGWSDRQEAYVLLSGDSDEARNEELSEDAYCQLYNEIPLTFTSQGETVAELGTGFLDNYGTETVEITLEELWHATLLQYALDKAKRGICFRMTSGYYLGAKLDAHAAKAKYSIKPMGPYTAFQHMPIRREIGDYVRSHYERTGGLPWGPHTLPSGLVVTFPEAES